MKTLCYYIERNSEQTFVLVLSCQIELSDDLLPYTFYLLKPHTYDTPFFC